MINKTYKIINNKFPKILNFVFYLRYLFLIFLVSLISFFLIPNFFDYKKKESYIKVFLQENYNLDVKKFNKINFKPFPLPRLEINELKLNITSDLNLTTKKLVIYPKTTSLYNFKNFKVKKIKLESTNLLVDFKDLKFFSEKILNLKKKIYFKDLNIKVKDINKEIINLNNIEFINYGYKKNKIKGIIFDKKFKIILQEDLSEIDFDLVNSGVSFRLKILKDSQFPNINGNFKGNILKSNIKFNYIYDENNLIINDLFFRDKSFSFNSNGKISFKPFSHIALNTEIKDFDKEIIDKLNLEKILNTKEIIKKINTNSIFSFKSKQFSSSLIDEITINANMAYGNLIIQKKIFFLSSELSCLADVDLLDEFPTVNFNCKILSKSKKKFLNKFDINVKKDEKLDIVILGTLNILNKKINFEKIKINENYIATNGDLKYFKESFENILFDKNFLRIFDFTKIKKFVNQII